ncbi:MAG: MerR family transcriptional regulator [Rickettsiales bacterium]|jgi:DNA-binding transcriptional MerR regulator|nr:MerR family transcriptional regulator [Rickettsiales bacterium]
MSKKRSIGEAAKEIGVPEHVLRFWEKEFGGYISPTLGIGGRRYYYDDDMAALLTIKKYLYEKGFTIKGVKNLISNNEIEIQTDVLTGDRATFKRAEEKAPIERGENRVQPALSSDVKYGLKNLRRKMNELYEKLRNV